MTMFAMFLFTLVFCPVRLDHRGYEIFEGDMMFTKSEIEAAENGRDPSEVGGARALIKNRRWPNGVVPYVLDKSVSKYSSVSSS
jgi:hypothetical protein